MKKAIFLDRDGVLCEDTNYVSSYEKFHIFPFAKEAIEKIHQAGYLAILITNQSGIARGLIKESLVIELNAKLKEQVGIDAIYYCPHLPPENEDAEKPPYRIFCNCRKPLPGMIEAAIKKYGISREDSYMIGDRESDIIAGKRAGVKTVLISNESDIQSDYSCINLLEFVEKYL